MNEIPRQMLDPEFVIPSPTGATKTEFWERMLGQSENRASKLGPATLEALQDLALAPPPPTAIAGRDFWRILNLFMSRGFVPAKSPRTPCPIHFSSQYRPAFGDPGNLTRLIADVAASGGDAPLLLMSLPEVWIAQPADCPTCIKSRVVRLTSESHSPTSTAAITKAWQTMFVDEHPNDLALLPAFAAELFPNLTFHDDAWNHLNTLEGAATENVAKLVLHLGTLDDHAAAIWSDQTETADRQAALGSRGVTASPEGSNTRRSSKKMQLRDFWIDEALIRCEWHTKLRPNINRVYFAVRESRVYVGTIVDHLPT